MPAFTAPGILFLNTWDAPERSFGRKVLRELRERGYTRYVEPAAGAFTMPIIATQAGWAPEQIDSSDVGLYSSIVGYMLAGKPLESLQFAVDGELVELPDATPERQAAFLLWKQLLIRTQARPQGEYWMNMVADLIEYAEHHQEKIHERLVGMMGRLAGLEYRPLDIWTHLAEIADDPTVVVNANPPTFLKGFERFFDTKGRLTWAEPEYQPWDPVPDTARMHEYMKGKAALLLYLQQKAPGEWTDTPVFGRHLSPGQVVYLNSNRPEEVFEITGGPKIASKVGADLNPLDRQTLPWTYEITPDSRVELLPVKSSVMDYYRGLWVHRLVATPGSYNLLVLVDGYVAGGIGYGAESIIRPYKADSKWAEHLILRFAFGAPHDSLRTTRLATMLALTRTAAKRTLTGQAAVYLEVSKGCVTVEYTRHPEVKGLRGLMKLASKDEHPDGFKLIYAAEWNDVQLSDVVAEFCRKEAKWQASRTAAAVSTAE
jgi:hypothetical protein